MIKKRTIQYEAGCTTPQLQVKIIPLKWGLAFTYARNCGGFQVGPLSVMVWWRGGYWHTTYKNDFRGVDKADR